jgi:predicted glycosyltransferase
MPERVRRRLKRSQATRPDLTVLEFEDRMEPLLDRSDRLVSMGGYNTLCEALAHGKPTLVVPRVRPRTEQLIRAERLQELGLVQMLHPDQATPDAISEWLSRDIPPPPPAREVIDFHGTRRIPALLTSLLNGAASRRAPEVGCVA